MGFEMPKAAKLPEPTAVTGEIAKMNELIEKVQSITIPEDQFKTFIGTIYEREFEISYFMGDLKRGDYENVVSGNFDASDLVLKLRTRLDGVTLTPEFLDAIGIGKVGQIITAIFDDVYTKNQTS